VGDRGSEAFRDPRDGARISVERGGVGKILLPRSSSCLSMTVGGRGAPELAARRRGVEEAQVSLHILKLAIGLHILAGMRQPQASGERGDAPWGLQRLDGGGARLLLIGLDAATWIYVGILFHRALGG
jgi:hypothetical protein